MEAATHNERALEERTAGPPRAGDEAAFAALYERHFQGVHDFAARIVRDRELAADVVQATFVKAWQSLAAGKQVANVKAWLYAIARNQAIDELRRRGRERPAGTGTESEEPSVFARPDPSRLSSPQAVAEDDEIVELVWSAAAGLSPQDYSLLDMHLRRDFDADEIADALGLRKGAVYTRLSRMKDSLEDSVASLLLVRRGRRDCPELDALVDELGEDGITPEVRRAVGRHVHQCERCEESRRRFASPLEVFGALMPVPALPGVQEAVWESVRSTMESGHGWEGADTPGEGSAFWHGAVGASKAKLAAGVLALGALLAVLALLVFGRAEELDPSEVRSTSHRPSVPSTNRVVEMAWSPRDGADGYSIVWSRSPDALPDRTVEMPGGAASTRSAPLPPGRWYFVLRTRGKDGNWTATVRSGPYMVETPRVPEPPLAIWDDEASDERDRTADKPRPERRPSGRRRGNERDRDARRRERRSADRRRPSARREGRPAERGSSEPRSGGPTAPPAEQPPPPSPNQPPQQEQEQPPPPPPQQ